MTPLVLSLVLASSPYAPVPELVPIARPVTVAEFLAAIGPQPLPGPYKVCLIHPKSCKPVEVCFTLPCGCPKIRTNRHVLEFDYGKCEVEIRFRHSGKVDVYHDD